MLLRIRLSLLYLTACVAAQAGEFQVAVSDLIGDPVLATIQKLAEESSIDVDVVSVGSLPAMDALLSDEISLAIVAAPEGVALPNLSDDVFDTVTIAYSSAILAVSVANPIEEISLQDLRGIFGADTESSLEIWDELEVSSLTGRSIKPLVVQSEQNVSTELFCHTVLEGSALKLSVNQVVHQEVEEMLTDNIASIAVVAHLPDNPGIKTLMLSINLESPAFDPTNENVFYGDYPIRLPFKIVYKKDNQSELAAMISMLLSNAVAEIFMENHFFVPPGRGLSGEE